MIWVLRVVLGLVALLWVLSFMKARVSRRKGTWRLEHDDHGPQLPVSLSVVIPARNEAGNIGPCLDAVLAQDHRPLQVVVLDDGSSDGTTEILQAYQDRVDVVRGGNEPLPEGWFGKPWACQRASEHATGDWLLFIDADVRLQPRAASVALGWAMRNQLAMLSGFGNLVMSSFWEKVLQPAVGGLIIAGNDLDRVNDPEKNGGKVMANGQFILVRRDAYDAVGGHGAVRSNIIDDVGMARAVTAAGFRYHLTFMRHLFSCRMYSGLDDLWEGWTKNLFAGLEYKWGNVVAVTIFTFVYTLLPYLLLVLGLLGWVGTEPFLWGWALVALIQSIRLYFDLIFEQDPPYSLLHALGTVMLLALIWHSGIKTGRGRTTWKGRTLAVHAPPAG